MTEWECYIKGHEDYWEEDGPDRYCTVPGCLRRSNEDQPRMSCECELYDCDGRCCGGACSCTTGAVTR